MMQSCLRILASLLVLQITSHTNAHRSSGRLIIETAKKAYESAAHRAKRDVSAGASVPQVKLESLLLPAEDAKLSHVVEFDLIMDNDQFGTVKTFGQDSGNSKRYRRLPSSGRREKRKAVKHSIYHWPGAVVPYEIHTSVDSISTDARYRIEKAMIHWQRHTCITFVKYDRLKHSNYVTIQKGQWCASKLGMAGGAQPLYLALGCLDTGTIVHELGHTLGWVHEQARPDRDDYVTIKWGLVTASYRSQYVKHDTDFVNTYGVPYDYGSIMHYPSYGELITKDPAAQYKIGQRNRLSFLDIKLANVMYKCPERSGCDTNNLECEDGGFIDHTCKCVCPNGDHSSCAVTNSIFEPHPIKYKMTTTTAPPTTEKECDPWMLYENSYIPGYNDDVGFSLTIEECKKRCESETSFKCISFDYWKARKQCYLSSYTATKLQIRLSYDSRMVHYMLTECPTKTTTTTTTTTKPDSKTTEKSAKTDSTLPPYLRTTTTKSPSPIRNSCPFEYTNTGLHCVRPLGFPTRPVYIAEMECKQKLGAKLWNVNENELQLSTLLSVVNEGDEYWVKIDGFKSTNRMASFFDFCPYITKESGKIILKDTLCYKRKGFFCQL